MVRGYARRAALHDLLDLALPGESGVVLPILYQAQQLVSRHQVVQYYYLAGVGCYRLWRHCLCQSLRQQADVGSRRLYGLWNVVLVRSLEQLLRIPDVVLLADLPDLVEVVALLVLLVERRTDEVEVFEVLDVDDFVHYDAGVLPQ